VAFNLTGYKVINGTNRADTLVGTAGADAIFGLQGNDTLSGGAGNDILDGGTGSDRLTGGLGNDIYVIDSSRDVLVEALNEGIDTVYSSISKTLGVNFENLILTGTAALNGNGNALANVLTGNSAANRLSGLDGNDQINAGAGNDTLTGGNGNDRLNGETGNDTFSGGAGNDMLNGGAGNDTLRAGTENDGLFGGGGADTLFGEAGNDKLYGDGGNDRITGGAGSDILAGGQMRGGSSAGADTFAWARADVVVNGAVQGFDHVIDFGAGDRIDFTALGLSHTQPLANLVHVTDTAAGTVLSAAFSGSGFIDIAMLDGVHTTLAELVDDGALAY
jgi:Ca2+-binding RTX toxin-like protein